jgi:hypothetical protein
MEPTTQAMLVGGLLALLTVLLVGRSVGRRRARRAAADTETGSMPTAVEQPEVQPEVEAQVEAQAEVEAEVEVEVEVEVVAQEEPAAEPEPAPEAELDAEGEAEAAVAGELDLDLEPEAAASVPTRRRGLRRRRSGGGDPAALPVATDATDAPVESVESVEAADQAEVRALREQLRALEQVVQQQAADHPTAALARVEETAAQQSEAYLRQVSLVVRGLAAHTSEDESPRRTLARVAAAVERLGVPNQMERPILPVTKELSSRPQPGSANPSHRLETGGQAAPAPSPVPDVFAGLAAPSPVEGGEAALTASYSEPAGVPASFDEPLGFGPDADVAPALPSDADSGISAYQLSEAVLPVPPPAAPEVSGRRRGLSRKSR